MLVVVVFKQSGIADEMVLSLLLSLVVATPLDMNYIAQLIALSKIRDKSEFGECSTTIRLFNKVRGKVCG